MGLNLTYSEGDVPGAAEIERLRLRAERAGMRLLPKSHPATYWPGSASSLSAGNLDHVVASEHLRITGDYVQVRGWVDRKRTADATAGCGSIRTAGCFGWG